MQQHQLFREMANRQSPNLVTEFWCLLKQSKKWWLLPIVVLLVIFGGLLILAQGSAIAPFIYTVF